MFWESDEDKVGEIMKLCGNGNIPKIVQVLHDREIQNNNKYRQ